ncbi:MAG: hypothetical protein ACK504_11980 [Bacteroidota bacterium]
MNGNDILIIIVLLIAIVVFFLLREVNCWYFKINERTKIANEQLEVSKKTLSAIVNLELQIDKIKEKKEPISD